MTAVNFRATGHALRIGVTCGSQVVLIADLLQRRAFVRDAVVIRDVAACSPVPAHRRRRRVATRRIALRAANDACAVAVTPRAAAVIAVRLLRPARVRLVHRLSRGGQYERGAKSQRRDEAPAEFMRRNHPRKHGGERPRGDEPMCWCHATSHGASRISHRLARCAGVPLTGSRRVGSTVRLKFVPSTLNGS
jgi:hypothetical protein